MSQTENSLLGQKIERDLDYVVETQYMKNGKSHLI